MVGAAFLSLHNVKDACAEFLITRFHPQNVLGIRHFADSLSCTPLLEQSNKYIQQYFQEVAQSDEFLNLSQSDLKELVSRDELHVTSEQQVFEAVVKWVKHDLSKRRECLPELFSLVRLPLLTPECLVDYVAKEELIRSSHQCR